MPIVIKALICVELYFEVVYVIRRCNLNTGNVATHRAGRSSRIAGHDPSDHPAVLGVRLEQTARHGELSTPILGGRSSKEKLSLRFPFIQTIALLARRKSLHQFALDEKNDEIASLILALLAKHSV